MRARIVQIGNSRGVRIPKLLLEEAGLQEHIEIVVRDGCLVIRPASSTREGWDEVFESSGTQAMDEPALDAPTPTHFDEDEWQWE